MYLLVVTGVVATMFTAAMGDLNCTCNATGMPTIDKLMQEAFQYVPTSGQSFIRPGNCEVQDTKTIINYMPNCVAPATLGYCVKVTSNENGVVSTFRLCAEFFKLNNNTYDSQVSSPTIHKSLKTKGGVQWDFDFCNNKEFCNTGATVKPLLITLMATISTLFLSFKLAC